MLNDLISAMNKECDFFKGMLKVSKEKTDVLVKRNIKKLEEITENEKQSVVELKEIEREREEQIKIVAKTIGIDEDCTVSDILIKLDEQRGKTLASKRDELLETISEIKKVNELNDALINNSLEHVDFLLNLVTYSNESTDNSYGRDGSATETNEAKSLMDFKL